VFLGIVQGFLYHPKKATPDFKWQSAGHLILKVDLHPLPLTEFLAPSVITLKPAMRDQRKTGHGRKLSRTQFVLALGLL
jgi:hypothetical protein